MKRMLIITDSLGMPRENVDIKDTWTDCLISKYKNEWNIYTVCRRGGTTRELSDFLVDYTENYSPKLIIIQLGIVDCARRATPVKSLWFRMLSMIPGFKSFFQKISSKNHYFFTKIFNNQMVPFNRFKENLLKLTGNFNKNIVSKNIDAKIIFIPIANPGKFLKERVYCIQDDVNLYNSFFYELACDNDSAMLISPYENYMADEYVLSEDGHHLNELGNKLVFKELDEILKEF